MGENITEIITIDIVETPCNPVYIVWKNTLGGWSNWMFEFNQEDSHITRKGAIFEKTVFDLETAEGTFESLSNFPERRLTVQATGITTNEFKALTELNYTSKIYQMFKMFDSLGNPINRKPDGSLKRIELLSASTTSRRDTKDILHNIVFELEYPKIFVQTQL